MVKTKYTLKKKESGLLMVVKDGVIEAQGFNDEESALHSVWILKGSVVGHYYVMDGDDVMLTFEEMAVVEA